MIFFKKENSDIKSVCEKLDRYRYSYNYDDNNEMIIIKSDLSFDFKVNMLVGKDINEEAIEISENSKFEAELSKCDAMFEIKIENLDIALDEINTLIEVQGAVQDACKGYLFTPWNGNISEPWID